MPNDEESRNCVDDEVRVAYVLNEEDLRSAVSILAAGLTAYRQGRGLTVPAGPATA